jgi:ankyrin repeat domain-containing protein 50
MALAYRSANKQKAEIRLALALSHFEADLPPSQKAAYIADKAQFLSTPPDIDDVRRVTAEIDSKMGSGQRCYGPRFTNALQAVQQFAALGDIVLGASQNIIACSVWAVARTILLVSDIFRPVSSSLTRFSKMFVKVSSYFEKLSKLFMDIGRSAPCYESMALLYPQSKRLQAHVSEYFINFVMLCHQLLKFSQRSSAGRVLSSLSEGDLKTFQDDAAHWARMIQTEMDLLGHEKLDKIARASKHNRNTQERIRLMNSFSTYDFEKTWRYLRKAGKSTLLDGNTRYESWKLSTGSSTFVCQGNLGAGKSVLLANVVDDLILHTKSSNIAYFFCRHDDPPSLEARVILGAIVRQLLHKVQNLTTSASDPPVSASMDIGTVMDMLRKSLPPKLNAHVVLDGLDECNNEERRLLLRNIARMQKILCLRLCLSIRTEPLSSSKIQLGLLSEVTQFSIPESNPDLSSFIAAELQRCRLLGELHLRDSRLEAEIQEALQSKAQGMFLWVVLQIKSLCTELTDDGIRNALSNLPKSLSETFSRILQKAGGDAPMYQRPVFEFILAAMRPLNVSEVGDFLSVEPNNLTWTAGKLLNNPYAALSQCGSLVIVEEEDLTVRLVHESVKGYLLNFITQPTNCRGLTISNAHSEISERLLTYVNYNVFDTQLTKLPPKIPANSVPTSILGSAFGESSIVKDVALSLLQKNPHKSVDIGRAVATTSRRAATALVAHSFDLLPYARRYLLGHILACTTELPRTEHLLLKSLMSDKFAINEENGRLQQDLLARACKMGALEITTHLLQRRVHVMLSPSDYPNNSTKNHPLWLAAINNHKDVARVLIDFVASALNELRQELLLKAALKGDEGATRLILDGGSHHLFEMLSLMQWISHFVEPALEKGHQDVGELILETLLGHQPRPGSFCFQVNSSEGEHTPLTYAIRSGNYKLVDILLRHGANIDLADSVEGDPPLALAATLLYKDASRFHFSHKQDPWRARRILVSLLHQHVQAINYEGDLGWTPLMLATAANDAVVVELLLLRGADVNFEDADGRTPLALAAAGDFVEVAARLLAAGASTHAGYEHLRMPLMLAAQHDSDRVAKLFLDHSKGLEIEWVDDEGKTAFSIAVSHGSLKTAVLLSKHGADLNTRDTSGCTPLHVASRRGYNVLVSFLLDRGVPLESCDREGRTALVWAMLAEEWDTVSLLLDRGACLRQEDERWALRLVIARRPSALPVWRIIQAGLKNSASDFHVFDARYKENYGTLEPSRWVNDDDGFLHDLICWLDEREDPHAYYNFRRRNESWYTTGYISWRTYNDIDYVDSLSEVAASD